MQDRLQNFEGTVLPQRTVPSKGSPTFVLLVTRPGAFQEGLQALLMATGRVASIVLAHDDASATQAIHALHPAMVMIKDLFLKHETHSFLQILVSVHRNWTLDKTKEPNVSILIYFLIFFTRGNGYNNHT